MFSLSTPVQYSAWSNKTSEGGINMKGEVKISLYADADSLHIAP